VLPNARELAPHRIDRNVLEYFQRSGLDGKAASTKRSRKLPDHVEVLPGAFRSLSGKPTSTIGFERRFNKAFRVEDEAVFVSAMMLDIPPPPPKAARTRAINAGKAQ